jgi:hypothetical protein
MSRTLAGFVAVVAVVWSACNMPRPTPYAGSPGFPNSPANNSSAPVAPDAGIAEPAPHGAPQSPLIGTWQSNDEALDIRPDGTVIINGKPFTYAIGGQTLFVQAPNGSAVSYPFELTGNELTVTVSNQRVIYTRTSAPPPPAAPAAPPQPVAAGAAPPAAPPPSAGGSTPPELVGKWCYMANVHANDGGRQSSTCFALNGDGSYHYHSETSSSGNAYGAWGTSSQTDDYGRWSANGNTLTATSNTGRVATYTFEKRNHPKNNDPMLVVNGEAFVTYFQKPPW